MKGLSFGNISKGASTLEILIAFAILTLVLSAAAMVVFGNQDASLEARLSREALSRAQAQLEDAQMVASEDTSLVNATTSQVSGATLYTESLSVSQIDLFTKQATSTVSWVQNGRTFSVALSTLLSDTDAAEGGNTCSSVLTGNWGTPSLSSPIPVGSNPDGNPVTSVVAFNKKLYVTTDDTHGHNNDFYIFDISAPTTPVALASLDTNTLTPGDSDVAVASTSRVVYAFVANMNPSNWNTCTVGPKCAQVQVIDVTNAANPTIVQNLKIPATSAPSVTGSGGQAIGNTVTYKNGYLYIGLSKTGSGPEFVIYDVGASVGTPTNPVYVGSYAVGRGINKILISHGYAYLATDDPTREILVLDVHTPSNPVAVGVFNAPGSNTTTFGLGHSLALVGSTLYFGRNYISTAPELYLLDATTPASTLPVITSVDVGTSAMPESVVGLVIRDNLAFVLMTDFLNIYDVTNTSSPTPVQSFNLQNVGAAGTSLACEGNYVYIGASRASDNKGLLYTLSPGS